MLILRLLKDRKLQETNLNGNRLISPFRTMLA